MGAEHEKGVLGAGKAAQYQPLVEFLKFDECGVGDKVDFSIWEEFLQKFLGVCVANGDEIEAVYGACEGAKEDFARNFARNYWADAV